MKHTLYIIGMLALLQGCTKDERIFDTPATGRVQAAVDNCKAILAGAPQGWLMEYYPEPDRSMGGYNLICRFSSNGEVHIAGELATANCPAGTPARSRYDVIADEGAVLTFNTYNEVLHAFTEPHPGSDVDGYAGDYEFVIRQAAPGEMEMTGKKYGNRILLTPYTGGDSSTWAPYLRDMAALDSTMRSLFYRITVNGQPAVNKAVPRSHTLRLYDAQPGATAVKTVPYMVTRIGDAGGIKLYEPLTLNGETAQHFVFHEAGGTLAAVECNMVIELVALAPNAFLADADVYWTWLPDTTAVSDSASAILLRCATELFYGAGELMTDVYAGHSPFGESAPGRGFVFATLNASTAERWYGQVLCDFTPAPGSADMLHLTVHPGGGDGLNTRFYYPYFKPFLDAVEALSPYRVTLEGNPRRPSRLVATSIALPAFYFNLTL